MKHLIRTAATLSATLMVVASCHLSAFEQGTYFIYQLVDQSETQPIDKRLVVNSDIFEKVDTAQAKASPTAKKRSEFEMNYNSLGTTNNSDFDGSAAVKVEAAPSSKSSAFNLGTQSDFSSFGN